MPDDELFAAAESGDLDSPQGLGIPRPAHAQGRTRARELVESFAFQWLQLNELFGSRPDPQRFPLLLQRHFQQDESLQHHDPGIAPPLRDHRRGRPEHS